MVQGTLKVNTEKILPIIKKWLYSDRDIFIRELISNACDALNKLRILSDKKEASLDENSSLKIELNIDKQQRTLQFTDTGIGMTAEEVEKYIAQLAFSGAEEFLGKYQSESEKDQIIGHFGLGFYSAYMVASKVDIDTLSYQVGAEAAFWSCDGSTSYTLDKSARKERGTTITLHIDEENKEYLEEARVREILNQYCAFLPFPIYLNGEHINAKEPLWNKPASECSDKEYLDFYRQLYPMQPDPIFWIHLNIDYPFHLKGILYFPKISRRFDWKESEIKLFCNRVFVSNNCKELLPDFLMILKGAIDSPDIPLNVSRSYLQMDKTVRQLSTHVSKKVAERLAVLYRTERDKFLNCWEDIEVIIKLGMLQDDKFYERAKEFLVWKTLSGNWTTLDEYIEKLKETETKKIFYTTEEKISTNFLNLYKSKGLEVLIANAHLDTALINFLEGKQETAKFQRIDGAVDTSILDPAKEKTLLDAEGKTEASKIADFIRSNLALPHTEIEAKSLASEQVPGFILVDEEMRRMRDYLALSSQTLPPGIGDKRTFVVNTNSKLIHAIYGMKDKKPDLAKELIQQVYELTMLSQKELTPTQLPEFIDRSNRLLEQLLNS